MTKNCQGSLTLRVGRGPVSIYSTSIFSIFTIQIMSLYTCVLCKRRKRFDQFKIIGIKQVTLLCVACIPIFKTRLTQISNVGSSINRNQAHYQDIIDTSTVPRYTVKNPLINSNQILPISTQQTPMSGISNLETLKMNQSTREESQVARDILASLAKDMEAEDLSVKRAVEEDGTGVQPKKLFSNQCEYKN